MERFLTCWGVLAFVLLPIVCHAQKVRLNDNSDWWSILKNEDQTSGLKPGDKLLDDRNFRILGVAAGENQFEQAFAKLGKATEIDRGDAASARHQVCYQSASKGDTTYLVFELGEVAQNFYIFSGVRNWSGSDLCRHSKLVFRHIATPSGLKLGIDRRELEEILGKPDRVEADEAFYWRQGTVNAYDVSTYVEAHFQNDKLEYLALSKVETD